MADRLGASTTVIRERHIEDMANSKKCKKSAEVLIRKVPDDSQFIDIKIAIIGNVESGKSTVVSVLTHGELDNGCGRARLNLFRHPHEIQTGRTSSINNEIMGFDDLGRVHVDQISDLLASEVGVDPNEAELLVDVVVVAGVPNAKVGLGVTGAVIVTAAGGAGSWKCY